MSANHTNKNTTGIKKKSLHVSLSALLLLAIMCGAAWSGEEIPLELPKEEGSKSFDFEIDKINHEGIQQYRQGKFAKATNSFKQSLSLAQQFRDPSQGILHYNLALALDKSEQHEEAAKQFSLARRFARGNPRILESKRLKIHECGFNANAPCKQGVPLEMNIEGSH